MFSSIKVPDLPSSITFFSLLTKFPRTLFPGQAACKTIHKKSIFKLFVELIQCLVSLINMQKSKSLDKYMLLETLMSSYREKDSQNC